MKNKLKEDYEVEIEGYKLEIEGYPTIALKFDGKYNDVISNNLKRNDLKFYCIAAKNIAVHYNWVFPCEEPMATLLSKSPYTIEIKGTTPLVYAFVLRILQDKS